MALQTLPLRIRKIAWITYTHPSSLSREVISAISKTGSKKVLLFEGVTQLIIPVSLK
jgi:hypothetical protein